ncbi:MAG: CpsB/CapC family capsule biosynthesis tyrosine phosphatase [Thermodesulfobacteriota bacterium]|nr:CpsB/CapC family capsule biosynthesis tyrosine phosphatase [Thermodesulfobacteriota bacterium]
MIDIHSHILPFIDDGPDTMEQAVKMVQKAFLQGITVMIATPHCNDGVYNSKYSDVNYRYPKGIVASLRSCNTFRVVAFEKSSGFEKA